MIVDPIVAAEFIETYKRFLRDIYLPDLEVTKPESTAEKLHRARKRFLADPSLLEKHMEKVRPPNGSNELKMLEAVKRLQYATWVYLKDTRYYSVFVNVDTHCGYGVLGLTEPIRDIFGGSGVLLESGIFPLDGRFVCDGLISRILWLGKNYRRSYGKLYSGMRRTGKFYTQASPNEHNSVETKTHQAR